MYAPPLLPEPMIENCEAARAVAERYAPRKASRAPELVGAVVFVAFGIALGLAFDRLRR